MNQGRFWQALPTFFLNEDGTESLHAMGRDRYVYRHNADVIVIDVEHAYSGDAPSLFHVSRTIQVASSTGYRDVSADDRARMEAIVNGASGFTKNGFKPV